MNTSELQGLWRRDWLHSKDFKDNTTRVFWAQSGELFVDLRIPVNRPSLVDARCLADLSAAELSLLMQSEAFAGTTELVADICTWKHTINWHGRSDGVDAGRLWFDSQNNKLMEDGVHADYREQWSLFPAQAFRATDIEVLDMSGLLLLSEAVFVLGIGPENADSSDSLKRSLVKNTIPAQAYTQFSSEYCLGHWDGNLGIVELSTNPFRESQAALEKHDGHITWVQQEFDGTLRHHTLCADPLAIA